MYLAQFPVYLFYNRIKYMRQKIYAFINSYTYTNESFEEIVSNELFQIIFTFLINYRKGE